MILTILTIVPIFLAPFLGFFAAQHKARRAAEKNEGLMIALLAGFFVTSLANSGAYFYDWFTSESRVPFAVAFGGGQKFVGEMFVRMVPTAIVVSLLILAVYGLAVWAMTRKTAQ